VSLVVARELAGGGIADSKPAADLAFALTGMP
jgi:hypothetical protein